MILVLVAGRFPLYADANIHRPVVDALIDAGWDVVRVVDAFPEPHLALAFRLPLELLADPLGDDGA